MNDNSLFLFLFFVCGEFSIVIVATKGLKNHYLNVREKSITIQSSNTWKLTSHPKRMWFPMPLICKGGKSLLVPTFSDDFHFSHYILFLPLLIPILKNASRFDPCRYIRNRNWTTGKWHALLA